MIEKRKNGPSENVEAPIVKGTALPSDYLGMVADLLMKNFSEGIEDLAQLAEEPHFVAYGEIFPDEVVLGITLKFKDRMTATTCLASVDYDPKASKPKVEDLLSVCLDAIGSFWDQFLDKKKKDYQLNLERFTDKPLSDFEGIPFQWTEFKMNKRKVFLMVDRSDPEMDKMADDWLEENDPELQKKEQEEEKEREGLFVVGPKGETKE